MQARWRTAAILVLLLIGLVSLSSALQSARNQPPPQPIQTPGASIAATSPPQTGELFPTVQLEAIDSVTLVRESGPTAGQSIGTWRKAPDGWQAVNNSGTPIPVDPANMVRMIKILSTLSYNRVIQGGDMQQFGLSGHGQAEITFTAGSGGSHRMRVGGVDTFSGAYYVQRDDDPAVYVVGSDEVAILFSALLAGISTPTVTP